jgi:hypothetical protein
MIVVDTSAILGAWYAHYLPDSLPGFWSFFDEAWRGGQLVVPRAVEMELAIQKDAVYRWVKDRDDLVAEPSERVQARVGELDEHFNLRSDADNADPFVIAEAQLRGFAVATYEGRSPTGTYARTKAGVDNIPTICAAIDIECLPPGEAWRRAGLRL